MFRRVERPNITVGTRVSCLCDICDMLNVTRRVLEFRATNSDWLQQVIHAYIELKAPNVCIFVRNA